MDILITITGLTLIAFFGLWIYDLKAAYQVNNRIDFKNQPIFKYTAATVSIIIVSFLFVLSGFLSSSLQNGDVFFIYFFSAVISLLVSYFWFQYIYNLDVFEPEKLWIVLGVFIAGAFLCFLSLPLLKFFKIQDSSSLLYSILIFGFIQEILKLLPLILLARFTKILDEPFDFILFGAVSALGFAFVENSFILFYTEFESIGGHTLYSSPLQMIFTSTICYYWAIAVFNKKKSVFVDTFSAFVSIVIIHGLYHFIFLGGLEDDLWILSFVFLLLALKFWIKMVNNLINISNHFDSTINIDIQKYKYSLTTFVVVALAFTYIAKSLLFGSNKANELLLNSVYQYSFLMAFVGISFSSINIIHGYVPPLFSNLRFSLETFLPSIAIKKNCSDTKVKLFFSNKMRIRDSGAQLADNSPIIGTLKRKVVYGTETDFYLFKPDQQVTISSYLQTHFLINCLDADRSLCSKNSVVAEIYGLSNKADITKSVFKKNKARKIHLIRCKGLSKS